MALSAGDRRLCTVVALGCPAAALLSALLVWSVVYGTTFRVKVSLCAGLAAGLCVLVSCGCLCALFAAVGRRRARRIAGLAERLDLILRDVRSVQGFDDYEEGELSVLANELQKACTLLRNQADALRGERDRLADSLADISHQLRTPLMSINLSLELLGRPDTAPERRRSLVRELRRTSDQMNWLVTSLLTLARADAGTLRLTSAPVRIADLVEAAVDSLRIAFELNEQTLEVALATGDEVFEGDAGWSKEALANVVKNCMEHTPAGGTVRIEASQDAVAARIVVTDTGPGIARHDLPHVFERFYKGEGSAAGSVGIGLALARCLVTAQGGTLSAGNTPRGGARFAMTFPSIRAL